STRTSPCRNTGHWSSWPPADRNASSTSPPNWASTPPPAPACATAWSAKDWPAGPDPPPTGAPCASASPQPVATSSNKSPAAAATNSPASSPPYPTRGTTPSPPPCAPSPPRPANHPRPTGGSAGATPTNPTTNRPHPIAVAQGSPRRRTGPISLPAIEYVRLPVTRPASDPRAATIAPRQLVGIRLECPLPRPASRYIAGTPAAGGEARRQIGRAAYRRRCGDAGCSARPQPRHPCPHGKGMTMAHATRAGADPGGDVPEAPVSPADRFRQAVVTRDYDALRALLAA